MGNDFLKVKLEFVYWSRKSFSEGHIFNYDEIPAREKKQKIYLHFWWWVNGWIVDGQTDKKQCDVEVKVLIKETQVLILF